MSSLPYRVRFFVMFGLSLFACALLLSPTVARADVLDINLSLDELRLYEEPTTLPSEVDQTYMRSLSNWKDLDPEFYQYNVITTTSNSGSIEYLWWSDWFDGYNSSVNNPVLALYIPLGSSIVPKDYKVRVSFPSTAWSIQVDSGGTTGSWIQTTFSVNSVWMGTSISTLEKCNASSGGYVAPKNSSVLMVLFNTSGRTGSRLLDDHRYMLEGVPKLYIEIPDPTAEQINAQSIENTETLMDTTGSNSLMDSDNMDAYQRFYNSLGPVGKLTEVGNQLHNAVNSQAQVDVVLFPGISLMGFVIPSQQVTISDKMLGLVERIRWITTFCFVAMFIRYLRAFVAAVFGTEEIGLWVSRDEDVEVQRDNMQGFTALGRYYNTDVHRPGRILR